MAHASPQMNAMKEIITCAICHELFTDARSLSCQHCFCLTCLQDFQATTFLKACPVCREDTVPPARELSRLPANREVNQMVGLFITQRDKEANQPTQNVSQERTTPRTPPKAAPKPQPVPKPQPAAAQRQSPQAEITLGDLLRLRQAKRLQEQRAEAAAAESAAEALAELFAKALFAGAGDDDDDNIHRGVQCDECGTNNIKGIRYKCGICADYDLCERCEAKPRLLVHDMKHIFVKLRRPRTRSVPQGPILDQMGYEMGQKMCFDSNVHRAVITADLGGLTLQSKIPISCDRCDETPIRGKRFKCGMCGDYDLCEDCEKQSGSFHPSDHVFLVVRHPTLAPQANKRLLRVNFY